MANSIAQLSAAQLKHAAQIREQIERLEVQLAKVFGGAPAPTAAAATAPSKRGGKRAISAAGRARIAAAQRARWAKVRSEKSKKSK